MASMHASISSMTIYIVYAPKQFTNIAPVSTKTYTYVGQLSNASVYEPFKTSPKLVDSVY